MSSSKFAENENPKQNTETEVKTRNDEKVSAAIKEYIRVQNILNPREIMPKSYCIKTDTRGMTRK